MPHLHLTTGTTNDANKTFKLMDVTIGDGHNSLHIIQELIRNKSSFEYHGIDISQNMIDIATNKINGDKLLSSALNNENHKIELSIQNAEDLSSHKDNSFDRYISSLCLMLTGNAMEMLKESYRILQPDGIAAFSIWG